jgi:probable DNA metabolism protein
MNYIYDGSFFGYISAVFDAYQEGICQTGMIHDGSQTCLFGEERFVCTDMEKAGKVLESLRQQCGSEICHLLYYAFLAEQPKREQRLLKFIRQAFHQKKEFQHHLNDESIWEVYQWAVKTGNERHRLLGLLRFRELSNGMLYGKIAPDYCVVHIMAPHFVRRLNGESWVIHDAQRNFGVFYDRRELQIVEIPKTLQTAEITEAEQFFSELWRHYYRTIAIKERTNTKLRRQFMPKKYWPYLIELNEHE